MQAQLKKWTTRIVETRAGSDRRTVMTGSRYGVQRWWRLIAGVLALALVTPGAGLAAEQVSKTLVLPSWEAGWGGVSAAEPVATAPVSLAMKTDWGTVYAVEPVSAATVTPALKAEWGAGSGKSYLIPALEIPAFMWLLNRYDRAVYGTDVYGTDWNTGWDHVIHGGWTLDTDPFAMNMIMHPYMGSTNYAFARSAGSARHSGRIGCRRGCRRSSRFGRADRESGAW